jgi:hypothetical protein
MEVDACDLSLVNCQHLGLATMGARLDGNFVRHLPVLPFSLSTSNNKMKNP